MFKYNWEKCAEYQCKFHCSTDSNSVITKGEYKHHLVYFTNEGLSVKNIHHVVEICVNFQLTFVPVPQLRSLKLLESVSQVPKYSAVFGLEYFLACKSTPLKLVAVSCPLLTFTVTKNKRKNASISVW